MYLWCAVDVEAVIEGGMAGEEPLCCPRSLEADPGSFPASDRLVRILRSIVPPSAHLVAMLQAQSAQRRAV